MNLDESHKEHLKQHEKVGLSEPMKLQLEEHYRISRELHQKYIKEESQNKTLKKRISDFLHIDEEFLVDVSLRFIIWVSIIYYMLKALEKTDG
jgi:hypothetical protein